VRWDADNPTAAAFREGSPREVPASAQATGALVVPLLTAGGCVGVLAAELQPGVQPATWRRAIATILAASLAQLVDRSRPARRSSSGRDLPAAR
jgi:GAF domain-containing protein